MESFRISHGSPKVFYYLLVWPGSHFKDLDTDISVWTARAICSTEGVSWETVKSKVKPPYFRMREDLGVIILSGWLENVFLKIKSTTIWKLLCLAFWFVQRGLMQSTCTQGSTNPGGELRQVCIKNLINRRVNEAAGKVISCPQRRAFKG